MPLLRINITDDVPRLYKGDDLNATLTDLFKYLPDDAPVIILVHGYQFSPFTEATDPHQHILSLTPKTGCWKALSWPHHLGFGSGHIEEGLCIAVGWEARGSLWSAWRNAALAGQGLTDLISRIRTHRPGPVDVIAHSLGARVVLAALPDLPAGSIGRAVMMAAAEFQSIARKALATTAGQTAEVINITSRENDFYDAGIEWLIRAPKTRDRILGAGLGIISHNWIDMQVDCTRTRHALKDFGYNIPAPTARICHWSTYLRPGLLSLYCDMIRKPDTLPLNVLRKAFPKRISPRWSRLRPLARILLQGQRDKAPT